MAKGRKTGGVTGSKVKSKAAANKGSAVPGIPKPSVSTLKAVTKGRKSK